MIQRYSCFVLALAASLVGSAAAQTGIPAPSSSIVPAFMVGSPDGAFASVVLVRDIANNPVSGVLVVLDFSDCPQFRPCPIVCADCVVDVPSRTVRTTADASGAATFRLRLGGGACPNPPLARIYAEGVFLGTAPFAALDQDGDLSITNADMGLVHDALGTSDLRADFDGDHVVTTADETILLEHFDATCDPSTPTSKSTWGGLKSIYR